MSRKQKKQMLRIAISVGLLAAAAAMPLSGRMRSCAFAVPYLFVGWDILLRSARNIARGQVFDENFLMSLATLGAFVIGEYAEGAFVMIFYRLGEWFEHYAVGRSRRSIAEMMDIRPDSARVWRDGAFVETDPETVVAGDVIQVRPGERVPLDGRILEGESSLDTSALTGESLPRDAKPGDEVISGCINCSGMLRIQVSKAYGDSTVARILELVENAASRKAKAEAFITRFARYYTPCVVIAALTLAIIPSLFDGEWLTWMERALIFLVISCPCALVISVPLSYFGGIGGASRHGILVKGANYLEQMAKVDILVMDKTGTLTTGRFQVDKIHPHGLSGESLLSAAAHAESASSHPVALGILASWGKPIKPERVSDIHEIAGCGVRALVDGKRILVGTASHLSHYGIQCDASEDTAVHLAIDGRYAGYLLLRDTMKPQAAESMARLRKLGVRKTVLLTGDSDRAGERAARAVGMDEWHCRLMPQDKVRRVESLLKNKKGTLAFVGDGINDAPVLSLADIGIAMGALGSDAAIEAADIVLMDDRLDKLPLAVEIARKTQRIVVQNIVFALGVKFVVMLFGAVGLAGMWAASFADVGVAVLAILNAMRCMKVHS